MLSNTNLAWIAIVIDVCMAVDSNEHNHIYFRTSDGSGGMYMKQVPLMVLQDGRSSGT